MRIEKFLSLYPKSSTKGVYRAGIYDFLDLVYGRVRKAKRTTKEEMRKYEELADRYFSEQRNYFDDLLRFVAHMNGNAPIGAKAKIAGVKEFLSYYGVEFTQRQLKHLSSKMPKGKTSWTVEKDIDHDMLKKILQHVDIKGRALILVLASSGMRIGEALQIKLSDLDLSKTPAQITIKGEYTKSRDTRVVFISREAKEALTEWLKVRDKYLRSSLNRNKGLIEKGEARPKSIEDDRVFPFSEATVRGMWERALRKAGLLSRDNTTGRTQIRIHGLRKFFRSQLALSVPVDIVEALMGHEGYLTEAYRRYTLKQLAEYYQKGEHLVTIQTPKELAEIESEFKDELNKNRKLIEDLIIENKELRDRQKKLEKLFDEFVEVLLGANTPDELLRVREKLRQIIKS